MTRLALLMILFASPALAETFQRPIPQPQTEAAEFWFLIASLALIAALVAVQMLVNRR